MSTDITAYANASLDEKRAYAQMLSAAGDLLPASFYGQVKNPETGMMERRVMPGKILMIAETGAMLGIHPMAAIQGIDVIEGNPTIKPSLMSALVRERGFKLRSWLTGTIEGGDIAAHATLVRPDDPDFVYESTWTPFDAIRAGKVDSYAPDANGVWHVKARSEKDKPLPWEAFTKRLLRWRVIGDVCSEGAEDVLLGVHYMPDELTSNVTADGEVVRVEEKREPAEDYAAAVAAAESKDELAAITERAKAAGDWNDQIRTLVLARAGNLSRKVEFVGAGPVGSGEDARSSGDGSGDPGEQLGTEHQPSSPAPASGELSEADYERIAAEEYAAAVARGEVTPDVH